MRCDNSFCKALGGWALLAGAGIGQQWPSGFHGYTFTPPRELATFDFATINFNSVTAAANQGQSVLVALNLQLLTKSNESEPHYMLSLDGGDTFSAPASLWASPWSPLNTEPVAFSDAFDNLYVLFEDGFDPRRGGLLLLWSRDGGRTFSDAIPVDLDLRRAGVLPRIFVDDRGVVHVAYMRKVAPDYVVQATYRHSLVPVDTSGGTFRLPGGGQGSERAWPLAFSPPTRIGRERFVSGSQDIAVDLSGRVWATYTEINASGVQLFLSRFNGRRFVDRVQLALSLLGPTACSFVRGRTGQFFFVFYAADPITFCDDMFFVTSTDGGQTLSDPLNLTNDCPFEGLSRARHCALDKDDDLFVGYASNKRDPGRLRSDLYLQISDDGGRKFTAPAIVPPGIPPWLHGPATFTVAPDGTLHLFWGDYSLATPGFEGLWYSRGKRE